ncbi:murein biosynthesis integral membrane protein MurJ [Sulfurimonas sp. HSL-1716]|uniref:murein biosynthesis integral membrane protein MurJ n=1 Tax=Hydrocurvibacter sulfurireducens TaxID=3131937 RepID=UPI0031F8B7FF
MFKAIFTNSFGILFSRILGLIRDLLTASILGANVYSDIFFIAFKLPNLFRRIFAEGAFTQVFLPSFTRSTKKSLFSIHIFVIFLSIILFITLLVNLFPQLATKALAIGFDTKTIELAAPYVTINFYYLTFIFAVTFLSTLLQYKHHFATTAFATGFLNLSLIGALLLSKGSSDDVIVYYLSWGVVIGGALQLLVHLMAIWKIGLLKIVIGGFKYFNKKALLVKEETKVFRKQFFPAIWGNSTAQLSAFLDTWLASFLAAGSISYLYYSNRVFQLPLALFAIATSTAIFPRIARFLRNNDHTNALNYLQKAFWFLATILMLSTLGGFILSDEIVKLLFQRGAFSQTDAVHTSFVLKMYLIGLLPFGLNKLFSLWLYASQLQLKAAKIASYSLISNVILSLALISPMGAGGLALASTISGFLSFILTIKVFGTQQFLDIISSKKALYWLLSALLFTFFLLWFKDFIDGYI